MGIPNYQDIIASLRDGLAVEAREKIVELREAALSLQEETLALKEKLKQLEAHSDLCEGM